jgi:curved DNA-binding protein CbpA
MAAMTHSRETKNDRPRAEQGLAPRSEENPLARFATRMSRGHYALLGVPLDADFPRIQQAAETCERELTALPRQHLSPEDASRLDQALARIAAAVAVLGAPSERAAYDARLRNYRGVARCITAGLTASQLAEFRLRFVSQENRDAAREELRRGLSADAANPPPISVQLDALERALALDPLNAAMHNRYWELRRHLAASRDYLRSTGQHPAPPGKAQGRRP